MTVGYLHVIKPGLLTTIQDLGRHGYQASGVPVAGPWTAFLIVSPISWWVTILPRPRRVHADGSELEFEVDRPVAITGAQFEAWCDGRHLPMGRAVSGPSRGERVKFGRRLQGARSYLGITGGIQTPATLGSRATHLVSRMGGIEGRALAAGDRIPVLLEPGREIQRKSTGLTLPTAGRAKLRVLAGPQADWFHTGALQALAGVSFRISPRSNRMGYRLRGRRSNVRSLAN